jgi:hypothetical protein
MAGLYKREKNYYAMCYVGSRKHRISLQTDSLQLAKEKIRQIESGLARGGDCPLPTRTPIKDLLNAYIEHIRGYKTARAHKSMFITFIQCLGLFARLWRSQAAK